MKRTLLVLSLFLLSSLPAFAQGTSIGTAEAIATTQMKNATINDQSTNHYFKVTTTTDGYLRFLISSSSSIDVDVMLYDTDGVSSLTKDEKTGTASEVFCFVKPGTYFLRVYRSTGTTGSYTIFPTFSSPTRATDGEPNETPATAVALSPTATSTGHLGYYGTGKGDADDYWKITTTEDGWLRVQLVSDSLDARGDARLELDVVLLDINGIRTLTSDNRTGTFSQVDYFLRPGTYFVWVYRSQGRAGTYQIKSDFFAPPLAADPEGNDDAQNATTATINGSVVGHLGFSSNGTTDTQDYWKFTTTADAKLTLQVTGDSLDRSGKKLELDAVLYDINGTTNLISDSRNGPFSECIAHLRPGTYYARVYRSTGNAGSYKLEITASGPPRTGDAEGNDRFAQATTLTYNLSNDAHIGYYSNGTTDTQDYWKLVAPSADSIYVHVWSDSTLELDMNAYASDSSSIIAGDSRSGTYSRVGIKPTFGATYYFRVYRSQGTAGSYTITATRSAATAVDPGETPMALIPRELKLEQNYPNPFNPSTAIRFSLPERTDVRVAVYTMLGQEVEVLIDAALPAAVHTISWNGKDRSGVEMASGMYLIRLQADNKQIVRKAMLVR